VTLAGGGGRRAFAIETEQASCGLRLRARTAAPGEAAAAGSPAGAPVALFVGGDLTAFPGGEVELWKPDPHGMAWVDVEGSPQPELYITRGGLMGLLAPPAPPKRDRYYLPGPDGGTRYVRAPAAVIPADHGRGRRVEWVDVDNDGVLELSIADKDTPNKLLARRSEGAAFADRAPQLGIDLPGAEVLCWGDHDGDGFQDFYFLDGRAVQVMRNVGGERFERLDGGPLGLELPASYAPATSLFTFAALRLADLDNDGDLDLWLLCAGGADEPRDNYAFRRDGERFTDVSQELGLPAVRGSLFATLLDVDNDGFEDVFSSGALDGEASNGLLWRNQGGARFRFERLPPSVLPQPVHAAAALHADLDGRLDVVCAGADRHLLRNVSDPAGSSLRIELRDRGRPAIGALARPLFARVTSGPGGTEGATGAAAQGETRWGGVRRCGSDGSTAYSQAVGALHFGIPVGMRLTHLEVRWPGAREAVRVEVGAADKPASRVVVLERPR
jgi:hypothetical protein